MESKPFIIIGEDELSLAQALKYLQMSGKLQSFVTEIARQYVLDKELESQETTILDTEKLQKSIGDFRTQNNLNDPQKFQQWLDANGMNYGMLESQIANGFKMVQLKNSIIEGKVEDYFVERKEFLDSVILSRIVVQDKELADAICLKIVEQGANFEDLVKEFSITNDRNLKGLIGPVGIGTLPDDLKSALDGANPGQIIGPVNVDGYWCVFRFEEFQPASFDNPNSKRRLENELFDRWLAEKMQSLKVKIQVGNRE
ncbi:MAG: peptidylprolyl isomerase [Okeania sp. SIO2H7]|nr:peptidylprolyl isomerase [Okeania sp. SIO2H7]